MLSHVRAETLGNLSPESLNDVLWRGSARHLVLEASSNPTQIRHWDAAGVAVDSGRYGFGVVAEAAFGKELLAFGFTRSPRGGTSVDGLSLGDGELQVYSEGCKIVYKAEPDTTWSVIQVPRDQLQRRAEARLGRALVLPEGSWRNLRCPADALADLIRIADSTLDDPERHQPSSAGLAADDFVTEALIEALDACSSSPDSEQRLRVARARTQVVRTAQAYLTEHIASQYDSDGLCRRLDMPERTLQHSFRTVLGVSPRTWFRLARLHRARAMLLRATQRTTVTDVALSCGFDQLGRFAVEYREVFGERPSRTLTRVRA